MTPAPTVECLQDQAGIHNSFTCLWNCSLLLITSFLNASCVSTAIFRVEGCDTIHWKIPENWFILPPIQCMPQDIICTSSQGILSFNVHSSRTGATLKSGELLGQNIWRHRETTSKRFGTHTCWVVWNTRPQKDEGNKKLRLIIWFYCCASFKLTCVCTRSGM